MLDLRPHVWFMARPGAALLVAVIAGIAALTKAPQFVQIAAAVLLLFAAIWFGWMYLTWVTTNFVVTTDRCIYRKGVIAKSGIEIPLERINTVFFEQGVWERMIGAGDLAIESAGESGRQEFDNVRAPSEVQNIIYQEMEDNENRKFDRINRNEAASGATAVSAASVPQQIEELDGLRRRGLISDAEFDQKKADLLRRM